VPPPRPPPPAAALRRSPDAAAAAAAAPMRPYALHSRWRSHAAEGEAQDQV